MILRTNLDPVLLTTTESVLAQENSDEASSASPVRLQNSRTLEESISDRFRAMKASILDSISSSDAVIWIKLGST